MKCPRFATLIDYIDGRLGDDPASLVASHLGAGCLKCDRVRQWYVRVRDIAATDDLIEPPAWVLKRALRLFNRERAPTTAGKLKQFIARLVFDSLSQPVIEGVRLTQSPVRQLLYRADAYSIDLQIAHSEESVAGVYGQVLREGETRFGSVNGLRIELAGEGRVLDSTLTNEMGEFEFAKVRQGHYELRIDMREGTLTIPQLVIT
ncbi:MAG TPA: hypothetical protein VFO63_06330 [Blastocatellia bacterium]|nr:hypothetical protein [Blastocatellia bacterium]